VLLDTGAQQCNSNSDCARFANTACDLGSHLCMPKLTPVSTGGNGGTNGADGGGSSSAACHDETGCVACPGGAQPTFLDSCTAAHCIAFDNASRLHNLQPDGGLKPLP